MSIGLNQVLSVAVQASLASTGTLAEAELATQVASLMKSSMAGALNRSGLTQQEQNQVMQNIESRLTDEIGAAGQQRDGVSGGHGRGGAGGGSWLEAIAQAMGQALGQMASKLVSESQALQADAGDSSTGGAQQFQQEMAQFQADSQMFSMLSNAFSTAIKSIGEGMQTMASKQ
jgi:hypothetical protein